MRMWNVDPKIMCRQHLLGEHYELHKILGSIRKGRSLEGYIQKNLIEIHNLERRHEEIVNEMLRRGWKHNSPLSFTPTKKLGQINENISKKELLLRCKKCRWLNQRNR